MLLTSAQSNKLIEAIRDQTEATHPHQVFVIDIVSVRFGGYFTPEIKAYIQNFPYLQMLTLNDCGIKSLDNFPQLPSLIRLDLVFNEITGESLKSMTRSRHLQTLMLGANKIEKIQQIQPLTVMKELLQLDFINNPVSRIPAYRNTIFSMFPKLTILDTLDKAGKDAYASSSMNQAIARVPDALFDRGPAVAHIAPIAPIAPIVPPPLVAIKGPVVRSEKTKKKAVKKQEKKIEPKISARIGKQSKGARISIQASKSISAQSGLVFPVGRIKRKLKENLGGTRIGKNSSIYLSAILEYLSAQLLEIAGNEAKKQKKKRITPECIKRCLKADQQLDNLLKNVTIGLHNL